MKTTVDFMNIRRLLLVNASFQFCSHYYEAVVFFRRMKVRRGPPHLGLASRLSLYISLFSHFVMLFRSQVVFHKFSFTELTYLSLSLSFIHQARGSPSSTLALLTPRRQPTNTMGRPLSLSSWRAMPYQQCKLAYAIASLTMNFHRVNPSDAVVLSFSSAPSSPTLSLSLSLTSSGWSY